MENLYEPSLTNNEVDRTRSYEISNLFLLLHLVVFLPLPY